MSSSPVLLEMNPYWEIILWSVTLKLHCARFRVTIPSTIANKSKAPPCPSDSTGITKRAAINSANKNCLRSGFPSHIVLSTTLAPSLVLTGSCEPGRLPHLTVRSDRLYPLKSCRLFYTEIKVAKRGTVYGAYRDNPLAVPYTVVLHAHQPVIISGQITDTRGHLSLRI